MADPHPPPDKLRAFAQGLLLGQEFSDIETHLERCDACCDLLSQQPEGTLVELVRQAATEGFRAATNDGDAADLNLPLELQDHPRYRLLGLVGKGGMGTVYRAEHRLMRRVVALKVVHSSLVADRQAIQRFRREVQMAARLSHPNIVAAYDADQAGESHFLVMECVDGVTLARWIAENGPAPTARACDWIRQAALGLQHAYEQGLAHRDIKPHNLMLTRDGTIKILDFGLTRLVAEHARGGETYGWSHSSTQEGMILGTPDYIAPEQISDSRSADIRADIYSLGCTLYHLLSGHPPFTNRSLLEKLHAHGSLALPPLDSIRADLPQPLLDALARMTAKDPAERYATPRDVAESLAPLAVGATPGAACVEPTAPPPPPPTPPPLPVPLVVRRSASPDTRRQIRSPAWIGVAIASVALVALLLVTASGAWQLGWFQGGRDRVVPAPAGPRLLLLLPSRGLWFRDYQQVVESVRAAPQQLGANAKLDVAGIKPGPAELAENSAPGQAVPDLQLNSSLRSQPYDAVIFIGYDTSQFEPGGEAGGETLRLIDEFRSEGKVVAALCAGQRALARHGVLQGKNVAICQYVDAQEITRSGGTPVAQRVVADRRIVTAATDADAAEFVATIVQIVRNAR